MTGQDRQPEERDEKRADERELVRRVAGDETRHDRDQRRQHEETKQLQREPEPHTRLTATRPNRPAGRTSSTVGSFNSWPTKPTYRPSSVIVTPSSRPPTTAPTGLSSPPSTAAAKAYNRIVCIMFGSRKTTGAIIIPATAPSTAAIPQPSANIQPTRMPTSRDDSGFTAAARSASPSFVKRKNSANRTTRPTDTATIPMSCTLIGTLPRSIVRVEN